MMAGRWVRSVGWGWLVWGGAVQVNYVIPAKPAPACFKVGAGIQHTHDIRCLDGLDPSLRWDDGFEGFLDVRIQMTKKSKQQRV